MNFVEFLLADGKTMAAEIVQSSPGKQSDVIPCAAKPQMQIENLKMQNYFSEILPDECCKKGGDKKIYQL